MNKEEFISEWEEAQFYIACGDLVYEIMRCKKQGYLSDELGYLFKDISEKIVERFNVREGLKKELVSQGILEACEHYENFDINQSINAYAYIVQLIKSGYAKFLHILYKNKI